MTRLPLPLVVAVLLAACAGGGATPSPEPDPDPDPDPGASGGDGGIGGAWVLARGTGPNGPIELVDGMRITLLLEGPASGGQACNHYGADVRASGSDLAIRVTSMTEMACQEPIMRAESAYHAALHAVRAWARDGERLVMRGDGGTELVFAPLPAVPQADLLDTNWRLDSLIDGDAVAQAIGDGTLELRGDGTMSGSTGCRDFAGQGIRVVGDQLDMATFGATDAGLVCPPQIATQDGHVFEVLGDGFIVELEGDTLTLRDPSGLGLIYRAAD